MGGAIVTVNGTKYGISVLPNDCQAYAVGYRFGAYKQTDGGETHAVDFFKTKAEIHTFVNLNPLYRAKKSGGQGTWLEGDLVHGLYGCYINALEVLSCTVGEYTGFKDRHGRKIFEGDIVRRAEGWAYRDGLVHYEVPAFYIAPVKGGRAGMTFHAKLEVVGNQFSNPELLEGRV